MNTLLKYLAVKAFIVVIVWAGLPIHVYGALSNNFEIETQSDVLKGTLESVSVDSLGWITSSLKRDKIASTKDELILAMEQGKEGVFISTGYEGRLYLLSEAKEPQLIFDSTEELLISMLQVGDELYAGSGPGGLIYRISSDFEVKTFARTGCSMVTAIALDHKDRLLVATADPGKIFRFKKDGSKKEIWDAQGEDISDLIIQGNRIIAGTSGRGRVVEIEEDGASRVIYETSQGEITSFCLAQDGSLYFASSPIDLPEVSEKPHMEREALSVIETSKDPSQGIIYRIEKSGRVQPIWVAPTPPIFSIARQGKFLISASGLSGMLHRIGMNGRWDILGERLDYPISVIKSMDEKTLLIGGSQGVTIHRFGPDYEPDGKYLSQTFDCGEAGIWGNIEFDTLPTGKEKEVRLFTRSGNTVDPEDGWSAWERISRGDDNQVSSPSARFIQIRLELNPGISVRGIRISYLPPNTPPMLTEVTVHPPWKGVFEEWRNSSHMVSQNFPDGLRVEYHFPSQGEMSKGRWLRMKGMRTVSWKGEDYDGDPLDYALSIKHQGGEWILLEKDYSENYFSFDTARFPDGVYEFRVAVTDGGNNPDGRLGQDEFISLPFLIDNEKPKLLQVEKEKRGGSSGLGGYVIHFTVKDKLSTLKTVEYAIDGGEWKVLLPEDNVLDEQKENFQISIPEDINRSIIMLKAVDYGENTLIEQIEL